MFAMLTTEGLQTVEGGRGRRGSGIGRRQRLVGSGGAQRCGSSAQRARQAQQQHPTHVLSLNSSTVSTSSGDSSDRLGSGVCRKAGRETQQQQQQG